ncbi:chemotaxis protein CheW [Virgibacillus ainsalahensis]
MENKRMKNRKVIVFQLADEEYAVSVQQVGSIERMQPITRVPQTPDFVIGVINLRGVVTPVIDLRIRLGMETNAYNESTRIIIVYLDDMELGLIVDAANDVIDISEDAIESAPEVISAVDDNHIEGVVNLENRLFILLNLQKVLTIEEMDDLTSVKG